MKLKEEAELRVAALAALTLRVVRAGRITPSAFSSLLGSWVHVLLFRRPALCFLWHVFRVLADPSEDFLVIELLAEVRQQFADECEKAPGRQGR